MKTKNILYFNTNSHKSYKLCSIKDYFLIAQKEQRTEVSSYTHLIVHSPPTR